MTRHQPSHVVVLVLALVAGYATAPAATAQDAQDVRVLQNLAQNALDAKAGELRITAERRAGAVVIELADTGHGIAPRALEHLFEPFAAGSGVGSGLGLAIARETMRLHGGDIELVETGATGTRFRLTLPD